MISNISIEAYFSNLGTKNYPHKGGARKNSIYVYLFKVDATPIDIVFALLDKILKWI